uniref:Uncharacterized protein n=1 Tax=Takifugu rubripes TaxID=31033 RepID=A0A674N8U7_TAKRU
MAISPDDGRLLHTKHHLSSSTFSSFSHSSPDPSPPDPSPPSHSPPPLKMIVILKYFSRDWSKHESARRRQSMWRTWQHRPPSILAGECVCVCGGGRGSCASNLQPSC